MFRLLGVKWVSKRARVSVAPHSSHQPGSQMRWPEARRAPEITGRGGGACTSTSRPWDVQVSLRWPPKLYPQGCCEVKAPTLTASSSSQIIDRVYFCSQSRKGRARQSQTARVTAGAQHISRVPLLPHSVEGGPGNREPSGGWKPDCAPSHVRESA